MPPRFPPAASAAFCPADSDVTFWRLRAAFCPADSDVTFWHLRMAGLSWGAGSPELRRPDGLCTEQGDSEDGVSPTANVDPVGQPKIFLSFAAYICALILYIINGLKKTKLFFPSHLLFSFPRNLCAQRSVNLG